MHKRGRPAPVSCQSCRSKKLKCNRVQPCSNCASRGISCVSASRLLALCGNMNATGERTEAESYAWLHIDDHRASSNLMSCSNCFTEGSAKFMLANVAFVLTEFPGSTGSTLEYRRFSVPRGEICTPCPPAGVRSARTCFGRKSESCCTELDPEYVRHIPDKRRRCPTPGKCGSHGNIAGTWIRRRLE